MNKTKKTDVEKKRSLLTLGQCVYRNSMPGLINARARLEKSCPWCLRTILQGTKGSSISIPSRHYQGVLVPHIFAWLNNISHTLFFSVCPICISNYFNS